MDNLKNIFIGIILFLTVIGGIAYLLNYMKKRKEDIKKQKEIQEKVSEIQNWFDEEVNTFEKKCIAYGIDRESDKQGISIFIKEKLTEKYGEVLLEPSLLVYDIFDAKFGSNIDLLELAIDNWLKKNSIDINQDSKHLKQIEKYILRKSYEKAKSIVSESANK